MLHFPALQTPSCCKLDTEPVHACPSVAAHSDYKHMRKLGSQFKEARGRESTYRLS